MGDRFYDPNGFTFLQFNHWTYYVYVVLLCDM